MDSKGGLSLAVRRRGHHCCYSPTHTVCAATWEHVWDRVAATSHRTLCKGPQFVKTGVCIKLDSYRKKIAAGESGRTGQKDWKNLKNATKKPSKTLHYTTSNSNITSSFLTYLQRFSVIKIFNKKNIIKTHIQRSK